MAPVPNDNNAMAPFPGDNAMGPVFEDNIDYCYVYIDDSNIWIEAKKMAAIYWNLRHVDSDTRCRLDIGNLIRTVCGSRIMTDGAFYGSTPPPSDSIWRMYEDHKLKRNIFERSSAGKEKEVDCQMACDITEKVTELSSLARSNEVIRRRLSRSTFVVVSGDRDMMPSVSVCLRKGVSVELWALDSNLATKFRVLARDNRLFTYKLIDDVFHQITYTSLRSTHVVPPSPAHSMAIYFAGTYESEDVCKRLMHLPYVFWHRQESSSARALVIEFVPLNPPKTLNLDYLIRKTRSLLASYNYTAEVVALAVHNQREKSWLAVRTNAVKPQEINVYKPLEDEDDADDCEKPTATEPPTPAHLPVLPPGHDTDQNTGDQDRDSDEESAHGFITVSSGTGSKDGNRRRKQQLFDCVEGQRCSLKGNCTYQHTTMEKSNFAQKPYFNFRYWKTRDCKFQTTCNLYIKNCPYAHSEEDRWCLICKSNGHFRNECPISRRQPQFGGAAKFRRH